MILVHEVNIKVKAVSTETITGLILQAHDMINQEFVDGHLKTTDGDTVAWNYKADNAELMRSSE